MYSGSGGSGAEIYMDLTMTYSFDIFIGYFFLDVILYFIVLLLQPVCKVSFIPNKVSMSLYSVQSRYSN